jgi:hypothetical protein
MVLSYCIEIILIRFFPSRAMGSIKYCNNGFQPVVRTVDSIKCHRHDPYYAAKLGRQNSVLIWAEPTVLWYCLLLFNGLKSVAIIFAEATPLS